MKRLIIAVFVLLSLVCSGQAANYPLNVLNIKPAGTGSPAIPAPNRIFKAHPGVPYNIRAAVTGGLYPYTYSLSNAPTGMSIDSATGEITWTDPQSNSGTITLTVTDEEGSTVTADWSVNVTTSGFIFVDSSQSTNGDGSIGSPYNSLENMLIATDGGTQQTDIVYFRGGTYYLVDWHTGSASGDLYDATGKMPTRLHDYDNPHTWIGYPGETVNIDGAGRYIGSLDGVWFDDLNFSNFSNYIVVTSSKNHYSTMRRCDINGVNAVYSTNDNFGCFFNYRDDSVAKGENWVVQDNTYANLYNVSAVGSLYYLKNMLVEDNTMNEGVKDNGVGPDTIDHPFMFKAQLTNFTARGNRIVVNQGHGMNAMMADNSEDIEICFNLFAHESEYEEAAVQFNGSYGSQGATYIYRNTFVGVLYFKSWEDACGAYGPWEMYNNIIVNRNEDRIGHYATFDFLSFWTGSDPGRRDCINTVNNLKRTYANYPLTANYELDADHQDYLGTHGWQTSSDGNYSPVASISAAPTSGEAPLSVSFDGSGSSDSDGTIQSYAWDFGDGSTGTGSTASHEYSSTGTYTATLTVTDDGGKTGIEYVTIEVSAGSEAAGGSVSIGSGNGSVGLGSGAGSMTIGGE